MNTNRVNEIAKSFTSITKDAYYKSEILPELFTLQFELVKKHSKKNQTQKISKYGMLKNIWTE